MSDNETPNRNNGCSEHHMNYLKRAAEACEAGDAVLGMHLYLAAYEEIIADPSMPDGMAIAGLHEAWRLACELKERSMAEYIFEKLEPYLVPDEIEEHASKLQDLALDRLEKIGFSREELKSVAEAISHDLAGNGINASVVKVESVSIPHADMFGVPGAPTVEAVVQQEVVLDDPEPAVVPEQAEAFDASPVAAQFEAVADGAGVTGETERRPEGAAMGHADVDSFNPYDEYRDYSIGKSWHAATVEGSGAEVFTRDEERAQAHEEFVKAGGAEALRISIEEQKAEEQAKELELAAAAQSREELEALPRLAGYAGLVGYDETVALMRDYGIGLQDNREYLDFVEQLNKRHGLDRAPALDSMLFRSSAVEDAARFVQATIEELGLPALYMTMEENMAGMPVLCITTQGDNRPRMNHAHNRFEAPAVLVIGDLDMWATPEVPEGVDGNVGALIMQNVSRGAREAIALIKSAVADPDVVVLATASLLCEADPFFYDLLTPMTVIDIALPSEKERNDIWEEIARDHPSIRSIDRNLLVRYSAGLPRYDMFVAAREALDEAYKSGLLDRTYKPVVPQNIFEKLAACQPVDSDAYREIEDEVVRNFADSLGDLDDLMDDMRG